MNANSPETGLEQPEEMTKWLRIAEAIERLERMFQVETNPEKKAALWDVLAQTKCT